MRHCLICILLMMFANHASAQTAFFVDGFHGGIYGHYPLDWYTQYIVDQLEANPDWVIGMEIEPETWDSVEVRTPDAYRKLKPLMLSERIDVTIPPMRSLICLTSTEKASSGSSNTACAHCGSTSPA